MPNYTRHNGNPAKLLEIKDWHHITPKRLQKYIDDGYIVDWIDGYDIGPTPLTNALMQDAPLEIVRSKKSTHENMQIELLLLRAGALDDIIAWLKSHKNELDDIGWMFGRENCMRKHLRFLGYKDDTKVFACEHSYLYIMEQAGKIWMSCDFDIYDNGIEYATVFNPVLPQQMAVIFNELGDVFAKQFCMIRDRLSPRIAMDQYYTYLASLHAADANKYYRIHAAQKDLRKHFSYNDWTELMYITPNITARAEYNKQRKRWFPMLYAWFHMDD